MSGSLLTTHRTGRRLTGVGTSDRVVLTGTRRRRTHVLGRTITAHRHVLGRTGARTRIRKRGLLSRTGGRVRTRGSDTVDSVHHRMTMLSISVTRGILHGGLSSRGRRVRVVSHLLSRLAISGS